MDNGYSTFRERDKPSAAPEDSKAKEANDGEYTVDEAVEKIGFGRFQVKLSCIAGFAWIADSMEIMVLSILGPTLLCQWELSLTQEALITTVVFIGFTIGSPFIGWLADLYGRRTALLFAAVWGTYYGVMTAAAPMYIWLLIIRMLCGVGIAGVPQAVTYFSEFLPKKYRGKSIVFLQMFWALGAVFEVVLAILILETGGWRWWLATSAAPLILFVPMCLTLPESPRYLMAAGRIPEAEDALKEVARMNRVELPKGKLKAEDKVKRGRFRDLLTPEYAMTTCLLWVIWFVSAFSYYGIVLMTTELIKAKTTCIRAETTNVIDTDLECPAECQELQQADFIQLLWTSVAEVPGLVLTLIYVDRIGRKTALCINYALFSLVVFLLFICAPNAVLVAILFVARALISSAFQLAYVYTPEVYPTKVRAIGIGACNIFARIGAIITPFIAQVLLKTSMVAGLSVYGCVGFVGAVAAFLLPIETRGRDLDDT